MTPRGFLTSLIYTAMIMTLHCKAVLLLPPPTELSHEWLDEFTLRLFWKKPEGLPDNSELKFMVMENNKEEVCVGGTNYTRSLLTEETDSDWTYSIWTLDKCCTNCSTFQEDSKGHTPATITIKPPKPRVLLLPPPTELSHEWLDKFTLRLFWKKPEGLPDNSKPKFMVMENNKEEVCAGGTNYTKSLLTEDTVSDWTYSIWTLDKCCTNCSTFQEDSKGHTPAIITIKPPKPRAKVVKDFRCFYDPNILSCSWIPVNPSLNLTLSYRIMGELEECIKSLKRCDQPYSLGKKNGCELHIDPSSNNIFVLVETEAGMSTFKPVLVVRPPELNIIEEGDSLNVNLTPPKVGAAACWEYEVCYKQCMVMETCQNTTGSNSAIKVPYDKHCLYEFKAKVRSVNLCRDLQIFSDFSEAVPYGKNEPPDRTLTVVAIVIPIILSICVILSCYCLRRHSTIICPTIPDPSTIFKEMMMNGPKDPKTGQNLYMPVPERLEPCRVILVPENCVLQQNS
ncbi:interleukin-13 receptor subunit alpha-1-like [Pagrus major]|uniref:interleukin-13 receptor subunit alpha-1-like n=1 Tax=Pagrus major TaxID=143350 RepID=UPI003CC86861